MPYEHASRLLVAEQSEDAVKTQNRNVLNNTHNRASNNTLSRADRSSPLEIVQVGAVMAPRQPDETAPLMAREGSRSSSLDEEEAAAIPPPARTEPDVDSNLMRRAGRILAFGVVATVIILLGLVGQFGGAAVARVELVAPQRGWPVAQRGAHARGDEFAERELGGAHERVAAVREASDHLQTPRRVRRREGVVRLAERFCIVFFRSRSARRCEAGRSRCPCVALLTPRPGW